MTDQTALEWPAEGNARVPYRVFADPDITPQVSGKYAKAG